MAIGAADLGTLVVRLNADISRFERNLNKAEGKMKTSMRGMVNSAAKGSAAISAAIGAIGIIGVKEFADFDEAMTKSTAIMGDLAESTKLEMANLARELAVNGVQSAEQLAESYYFLASAGLDAQQSMQALPIVQRFATAGAFDMATATDLLTDAQTALGMQSKDLGENLDNLTMISDALALANKQSNASMQQFSEALTSDAAVASRQFGQDLNEVIAALNAYAAQGIKGAEAGNLYGRATRLLKKAYSDNRDMFRQMNIEMVDSEGNYNSLTDIIADLENAFNGLSESEQTAALENLGFAALAQKSITPLLGMSDAMRQWGKEQKEVAGFTEEIANKQLKTFNNQMRILVNRVKEVFIQIGDKLAPTLLELNKKFDDLYKSTNGFSEEIESFSSFIVNFFVGGIKIAADVVYGLVNGFKLASHAVAIFVLSLETVWRDAVVMYENVRVVWQNIQNIAAIAAEAIRLGFVSAWYGITASLISAGTVIIDTIAKILSETENLLKKFDRKFRDALMDPHGISKEWRDKHVWGGDDKKINLGAAALKNFSNALKDLKKTGDDVDTITLENLLSFKPDTSGLEEAKKMAELTAESRRNAIRGFDEELIGMDKVLPSQKIQAMVDEFNAKREALAQAENQLVVTGQAGIGSNLEGVNAEIQNSLDERKNIFSRFYDWLGKREGDENQMRISAISNVANESLSLIKSFAGEQSSIYKTMFAATKAFAIAEATVRLFQSVAGVFATGITLPDRLAAAAAAFGYMTSIVSSLQGVEMASFLGGGSIKDGPRTGGVDGMGGRYAVVHPGEKIIDPKKGGNTGDLRVQIINNAKVDVQAERDNTGNLRVLIEEIAQSSIASGVRNKTGEAWRALRDTTNVNPLPA